MSETGQVDLSPLFDALRRLSSLPNWENRGDQGDVRKAVKAVVDAYLVTPAPSPVPPNAGTEKYPIERVVRDMVCIVEDPTADTDERLRALETIKEALDPQEPVDLLSRAVPPEPDRGECIDPCKPHKMQGMPLKMLAFASYCGGENPGCSEERPCYQCLLESNVFLFSEATGQYIGKLQNQKPASADAEETEPDTPSPVQCGQEGAGEKPVIVGPGKYRTTSYDKVEGCDEWTVTIIGRDGKDWLGKMRGYFAYWGDDGRLSYFHPSGRDEFPMRDHRDRCDITGPYVEPPTPPVLTITEKARVEIGGETHVVAVSELVGSPDRKLVFLAQGAVVGVYDGEPDGDYLSLSDNGVFLCDANDWPRVQELVAKVNAEAGKGERPNDQP